MYSKNRKKICSTQYCCPNKKLCPKNHELKRKALLGITANGQGFAAGVELVFRPPTTAAD
jgi:hypothetical protein